MTSFDFIWRDIMEEPRKKRKEMTKMKDNFQIKQDFGMSKVIEHRSGEAQYSLFTVSIGDRSKYLIHISNSEGCEFYLTDAVGSQIRELFDDICRERLSPLQLWDVIEDAVHLCRL